jgi:hopanoid biosynthesis associated RND transporter like protein HpnN
VLVALGLLTALAGVYVSAHFSIDSDLNKLIRPSDELSWFEANEDLKQLFPETQQTSVVVVSGADAAAVDRTAARLQTAFLARSDFEFVFAPALDPFLRDHRAYFLDLDLLEDWVQGVQYDYGAILRLADSAGLANATVTLADQVAATDGLRLPTAVRTVVESFRAGVPRELHFEAYPHLVPEADTHYVVLILKGVQEHDLRLPNEAQVRLIRSLIERTELDEGVRVRLTGEVPLAHEEIGTALEGIGIAGTISLLLLGVILHLGVGSWRIIAATFALLGVGVIWTLAFATFAVGSFNTLALIFVVMFFGLGVDFSVHFSLRMQEGMAAGEREDAEVHVVREIGPALLLCMLTSSIAFLSFLPTDYLGLGELGIISAGGMVIAFTLTLSLLPAFYSLSGLPLPRPARLKMLAVGHGLAPGVTLLLALAVALAALYAARDLTFDYSVLALRDENTEAMSTLLELQDNGVSTDYSINLLADDAEEAVELVARLELLPEVGAVIAPSSLVPEAQAEKAALLTELHELLQTVGDVYAADEAYAVDELVDALDYVELLREEEGWKPAEDDRLLVEAFLEGIADLQAQPDRLRALNTELEVALESELQTLLRMTDAAPFSFTDLPGDLRRRFASGDGRLLITVMPQSAIDTRPAMDAFVRAVMSVREAIGGRAVVEWGVGGVAVRSFLEAVTLAVALISLFLIIYFRGVVLPLVVLVPLGLTTVITFAVVQLTGLTLNMANILVVPLIFGLGVDTGIHVVHRYAAAGDVAQMMTSSTTRAVIISALTTIGTFFSLSFSPHKGAASVGLLLSIAISTMLVATLVVVPALLRMISTRQPGD